MAAKGGHWKGTTFVPAKAVKHSTIARAATPTERMRSAVARLDELRAARDARRQASTDRRARVAQARAERKQPAAPPGPPAPTRKTRLMRLTASASKRGYPDIRVTRSLMEDFIARGGGEIPRGVPGATRRERVRMLLGELSAAVSAQGRDRHAVTFSVRAAHDSARGATYHFKARLLNPDTKDRKIAINLQRIETHGAPFITRIERGAVKRRREQEEVHEMRRRVREKVEAHRRAVEQEEARRSALAAERARAEAEAKRRKGPLRVEGSVGIYGPTATFTMRGQQFKAQLWPHEARPRVTRELGQGRYEDVGRVKSGKNRGSLKKKMSPDEERFQARGERVLRAVIGRMRRTQTREVNVPFNPFRSAL